MKTTTVLLLMAFSAVVLTLPSSKPAGTMFPALNTNGPHPNTTTKAPVTNSTTKAPVTNSTTKAPVTNSTTQAPNTTTAATTTVPPTTTKAPISTNSTVGNYTLDNKGQRCLMVQMELKIRLEKGNRTFLLLPNQTTTAGSCDNNTATLILRAQGFNLTMTFSKNATTQMTFVDGLAFNLTYDFSKKSLSAINEAVTYKVDNKSVHLFSAKTGHSYSCKKESLSMGQGLYLDINQDRMQAFNFTKSNEFGLADPCTADQNNYRVAIAVGITLLVLVVVVVVAYLLARKKRTDGYQSL